MDKIELNFIDEFSLSRTGMIEEIKTEFDIIGLCLLQASQKIEKNVRITDRIIVMPLRKLLCEKKSVLLNVCPNFKMPPLKGKVITLESGLNTISPSFSIEKETQWVELGFWLKQKIAWFDRTIENFSFEFPDFSFDCIRNRLNEKAFRCYKNDFESKFYCRQIDFHGEMCDEYSLIDSNNSEVKEEVLQILNKIGYNTLSVFTLIKHLSDKRGAHIDVGHAPLIKMINTPDPLKMTPIHYFAFQMIVAAKKQIPELSNYWPEMPNLINNGG